MPFMSEGGIGQAECRGRRCTRAVHRADFKAKLWRYADCCRRSSSAAAPPPVRAAAEEAPMRARRLPPPTLPAAGAAAVVLARPACSGAAAATAARGLVEDDAASTRRRLAGRPMLLAWSDSLAALPRASSTSLSPPLSPWLPSLPLPPSSLSPPPSCAAAIAALCVMAPRSAGLPLGTMVASSSAVTLWPRPAPASVRAPAPTAAASSLYSNAASSRAYVALSILPFWYRFSTWLPGRC